MKKTVKVVAELVSAKGHHEYVEVTLMDRLRWEDNRPLINLDYVFQLAAFQLRETARVLGPFDEEPSDFAGLTVLVPFNDAIYGPRIAMAKDIG